MLELDKEEKSAIESLKRVSKKWPKSLWLFSASGRLWVMKKSGEGTRVELETGGVDQKFIVAGIDIENDGGDW
jgi:hypothetical protein